MNQPSLFDNPPPVQPVDASLPADESKRLAPKCQAVLEALRRRPHTNHELIRVGGTRAAARVHDLNKAGYTIESESKGGGLWLYTLKED